MTRLERVKVGFPLLGGNAPVDGAGIIGRGVQSCVLSAVFELIDEIALILFELGLSLRFLLFEVSFLVGNLFFGYADNFLQERF